MRRETGRSACKASLLIVVLLPVLVICCSNDKNTKPAKIDLSGNMPIHFVSFYQINPEVTVRCLLTGESSRFSNDPENNTNFGRFVEIKHNFLHQQDGKTIEEEFYSVYGMLDKEFIDYHGKVDRYIPIGTPGRTGPLGQLDRGNFFLGVWSYHKTDYLIDYFGEEPVKVDNIYWYNPEILTTRE